MHSNEGMKLPESNAVKALLKAEFKRIVEERVSVVVIFIGLVAIGISILLMIPRGYIATTTLIVPSPSSNAMGALAQMVPLGGAIGSALGVKTPDELYVVLLKSRTLQDSIISSFDLMKKYKVKKPTDARRTLSGKVVAAADKKSGVITLEVEDADPTIAASMANAHIEELGKIMSGIALTDAQKRRRFLDKETQKAQEQLVDAEVQFGKTKDAGGIYAPQALAETTLRTAAELRSQILMKEARLESLKKFRTPENAEAKMALEDINSLKNELKKIESGSGRQDLSENVPAKAGLNGLQAYRYLKTRELAYETLLKQLEVAKIDEARTGVFVQQLDVAVPPDYPSRPNRKLFAMVILVLAAILAGIGGMLVSRQRSNKIASAAP